MKSRRPFLGNLETSNTADPRLGTRICLAQRSNSSTPPASLKFLGRTGASPYQKCSLKPAAFGFPSPARFASPRRNRHPRVGLRQFLDHS
jgi:hypothetical protein